MKIKISVLLLVAAFTVAACSGSKSYFKKAVNLEKAGLTTEAADFYIEALKRNRTNEKAIIALKKTGQAVLDEQLQDFYRQFTDERYADAVKSYRSAESFKARVDAVGVKLNAPEYYNDYYVEARNIYVAQLYDKAQNYLDQEDFVSAERTLKEIKILDPSFKNVSELSDFAFVEPKYRQALNAYDAKRFRQAYVLFREINDRTKGYKESVAYMELALESAQFAVGILPIENKTGVRAVESGISGSIIRDLKSLNDPFLVVVDRTQTDVLLQEQFYNMTGAVDQSTARETGTLIGSSAILVGRVISARKEEGKLMKYSRTGWLGKEVRYIDQEGVKRTKLVFDKVYYYEYDQQNSISITFQYQLISTETGEVLLSDQLEVTKQDKIEYATFTGDGRLLYAGYWENQFRNLPSDRRFSGYNEKRELDKKLKGRTTINSLDELCKQAYDYMGKAVAQKMKTYNPEKV
jgi:hypothetical protein